MQTKRTEERSETLEMWQKLLVQCNIEDIKRLEGVVQGMTITDSKNVDCETWILSNQTNVRKR